MTQIEVSQDVVAGSALIGGNNNPFGISLIVLLALIMIAAWVILAGSRFIQGGAVERPERVPQLYGYTACLIGLVWALVSLCSIVSNAISLTDPVVNRAEWE